jgi:hypothetical protein
MMTLYQMEFIARERMREERDAAEVRRLLRPAAELRSTGPSLRTRLAVILGRSTARWSEAAGAPARARARRTVRP